MASLADRRCEVCTPGTPILGEQHARELTELLHRDWELGQAELHRRFRFSDFMSAFDFAERVAKLSELEGHHPDLKIGWGYLEVSFTTHAAHGLTMNDFLMAAKVDRLNGASTTSVE